MLFRNKHKELMTTLFLTKELEDSLDKYGARGVSLSDKIKSFDKYANKDFYDDTDEDSVAYAYREYKRNLIGGYYNSLRWVAHERNQIMHQDNYYITNYFKFKFILIDSIDLLNNGGVNTFSLRRFVFSSIKSLFDYLPFIIVLGIIIYMFRDSVFDIEADLKASIFYIVMALVLIVYFTQLLSDILGILTSIMNFLFLLIFKLQILITKNYVLFIMSSSILFYYFINRV